MRLPTSPPSTAAIEAWAAKVKAGDDCEIVGAHDGVATDGDGNTRTETGSPGHGEILTVGDDVTVLGADGLHYTLDWSDVGPVTGY